MTTRIKMKELERRTGVGREAIRYYIREGMLPEPEKPKRNVAYYTDDHVKRLRAIQHLKDERDLSLSRIKSVLDSSEFDALTDDGLQGLERMLPALLDGVVPAPDRALDEVCAETGVSTADLDALIRCGIVTPVERDGRPELGYRDVAIVRKWGDVRRAGFTRERGYATDTLERYRLAAEALAAHEVEQFLAAFGGVSAEIAADIAARGIEAVNDILVQLHIKAIMAQLEKALANGSSTAINRSDHDV